LNTQDIEGLVTGGSGAEDRQTENTCDSMGVELGIKSFIPFSPIGKLHEAAAGEGLEATLFFGHPRGLKPSNEVGCRQGFQNKGRRSIIRTAMSAILALSTLTANVRRDKRRASAGGDSRTTIIKERGSPAGSIRGCDRR
jgi:hypothetical protein